MGAIFGTEFKNQRELCRVKRENGRYGGYKKDILKENLTEREKALLICETCEGIMREASFSNRGGQVCSCCEVRIMSLAPNVALRKMISSLKCCCPLNDRGCDWLGTLNDCENHLDTCDFANGQCSLGCGEVLERRKLKAHEIEDCALRKVRCEHCDTELMYRELTKHLDKCPKLKVSCKLNCGVIMCREDMTKHLEQDCVEKKIKCPFAKYKCEVGLIKRKNLSQHLKEKRIEHLELKLDAIELKLSALDELVMKQTSMELKLNALEELVKKQSAIIVKLISNSPK